MSKWSVSTDSLERVTDSVGQSAATQGERAENGRGRDLWRNWEQLSGGGPTSTNQGLMVSPDRAQTPDMHDD